MLQDDIVHVFIIIVVRLANNVQWQIICLTVVYTMPSSFHVFEGPVESGSAFTPLAFRFFDDQWRRYFCIRRCGEGYLAGWVARLLANDVVM